MSPLQNIVAATHHEQKEALDLSFRGENIADRAVREAETEAARNGKEPTTLIPTVGDGPQLEITE